MTHATPRRIGALAFAATLFVAACSSGGGATTAPATTAESASPGGAAGGAVTGSISVSGSSTVEPISTGVAEALARSNPDFKYTIEGPGTGDGFAKFCAGETDISDASRKIKDEEAAICQAAGIEYTELKIAIDGLSIAHLRQQHGRDLPQLRRPVRADRPGEHRLRQVERRRGDREGAGLQHDASPTPT